jgi:hypothetical protein
MHFEVGRRPSPLYARLRRDLPEQIVLTHDGPRFFLYAVTLEELRAAREAIDRAGGAELFTVPPRIGHWEPQLLIWRQVDPPISEEEARAQSEHARAERRRRRSKRPAAVEPDTQRAVASVVGRLIRKSFEAEMLEVAAALDLHCEIVEHPHLLSTQVVFNLTGAPSDVHRFESTLRSRARATIRVDPGLIPYGGF